ncbi:MAG: carbohydrate kinase family protein [Chloroflexota bacterium]
MAVLVVGDANADLSARLRRFPQEGGDSPVEALGWGSGGAAVNVAAALAALGTPARLLVRVGPDPAADVALAAARQAGVDLSAVQRDEELATGLCYAAISPGGERTFLSYRGANVNLDMPNGGLPADTRWLHVCGHALLEGRQRRTALELIGAAHERGLPGLDQRQAELGGLARQLDVLFINEPELATLAGLPSLGSGAGASPEALHAALAAAADLLPPAVAVKLGARGCAVIGAEGTLRLPAFAVDALDTTGCGDAFAAGFIHATLRGAGREPAALLANALGALVATRPGAASALPSRTEMRAFLADRAPDLLPLVVP